MKTPALTLSEARALLSGLAGYAPTQCYQQFISGVRKLEGYAGGACCRDCAELGTEKSRLGGKVCKDHKAKENPGGSK